MKTVDKRIIELVENLYKLIDVRKHAEAQEKEMKAKLKDIMGLNTVLEAGLYTVIRKPCARNGLDMHQLRLDFDKDILLKYATVTLYDTLDILPVENKIV